VSFWQGCAGAAPGGSPSWAARCVFGLFHINPYHVLAAFAVGLLLGWVALESGSLLPGILIHLVNNGAQVLLDRVPGWPSGCAHPRSWCSPSRAPRSGRFWCEGAAGPRRSRGQTPSRCRLLRPARR
jgi:hypothetical protein